MKVTYKDIRSNPDIKTYVEKADEMMSVLGYTDHSAAHAVKVGELAARILKGLGYDEEMQQLCLITGYMHDIGNMVNRIDHAQSGALMAFTLLTDMGMEPEHIATIVGAIGNHDEGTGLPISAVSAAIIIADKTDVRRSRVRNRDLATFDIHDRVNYAVVDNSLDIDLEDSIIRLNIEIDTEICSLMDYFEIFLKRMILCRRAAEFLNLSFRLRINGSDIL